MVNKVFSVKAVITKFEKIIPETGKTTAQLDSVLLVAMQHKGQHVFLLTVWRPPEASIALGK